MKKYRNVAVATLIALLMTFAFAACSNNTDEVAGGGTPADGEYKIQYSIDGVTYTVDVKSGESYSIEVPERNGYVFLGLFDSEAGGTQYVNSEGSALALFKDNKNLLLFPRWAAKEYTLVLDYQGAEVTAERQLSVSYGSKLTSLPTGLKMANKTFTGWYTEPNKKGVRVADEYGVVPGNDMVSERNFDLSDPDGYIYLYAGFQGETFDVTFNFGSGVSSETVAVEYGTPISEVEVGTRVGGKAVSKWSLVENDTEKKQIFTGKVTGAMTLYAAEFAPVIDFYGDGEKICPSVVAEAGTSIVLPVPVKENYAFKGWYDESGTLCSYTAMPEESVRLTAKWLPMIVFDERGGKDVNDLCVEQGSAITLPTTEKAGYIFAGWYTETGEPYNASAMPEKSVRLRAMYRKTETVTLQVLRADQRIYSWDPYGNPAPSLDQSYEFNFDSLGLSTGTPLSVKGYVLLKLNSQEKEGRTIRLAFYGSKSIGETTLLSSHDFKIYKEEYERFTFEAEWSLTELVTMCYNGVSKDAAYYISDMYFDISYPDMTKLY